MFIKFAFKFLFYYLKKLIDILYKIYDLLLMESKLGISKYKNINAVTCYMNSTLAILQQSPLFCDYMISGQFKKQLDDDTFTHNDYNDLISYQIHKLFRISMTLENANLTPSSLRNACSKKDFIWGEHMQQDSSEFLQFLVTKIEEELGKNVNILTGKRINKQYNTLPFNESLEAIIGTLNYFQYVKKEFSPVKTIFTGMEQVKSFCSVCGIKKNNHQTFSILQLPIPVNNGVEETDIYKCIDKWSEKEKLDNMNRLTCDFCGVKSNITRQHSLYKPPKVLIIQLKRFKKDMYGMVCRKITNKVNYPVLDLDINKYISNSSPHKNKHKYNLFGVNIHYELGHSGNMNFGHYVSAVKNRYDSEWYLFNDEREPIKLTNQEQLVNDKAYLLFYYRTN
jgi:ubiquitin C-terminal hydrolase